MEDLVLAGVDSSPPPPLGLALVAPGERVGDVVCRWYPFEVGCPCLRGRKPPHGGHHAVDCAIVAVALGEGALAGDVVDISRPQWWQSSGERGDGEDLCEDLKGVDEGLPLRKDVEEPGRCLAEVIEDPVVDPYDVAPAVAATLVPMSAGVVWHMPSFDAAKMVACIGLGSPYGTNLGWMWSSSAADRVDQLWRKVGVHPPWLRRPFVYWLDSRPPHRAEHRLGEEAELAGEALRRRWIEYAGVEHLANHGLQLLDPPAGGLDRDALVAEVDVDALDHLLFGRRLGLARLGLEPQVAEYAAEGVEGRVGQVIEVHGVKVVDVVAPEEKDQGPHHQLDCVGCPVEVPDQRGGAEAHGHVHSQDDPATVGRKVAQCSGRRTGHCRYAFSMSWPKATRSVSSSATCRARSTKSPTGRLPPWRRCALIDASPRRV